jgi:DNA-binding transcriptional LysR family regulator
MVVGCTIEPLFDSLAAFHRAHPGVELTLFEDNSRALIDGVRAGSIDLALIGTSGAIPDQVDSMTIVSERLVAAVPVDHPLAGRKKLRIADLADYPIICMPTGTGIRTVFDQACDVAGVTPMIALQASAAKAIADLASRDFGVAILSESMAEHRRDLKTLRIVDATAPALLALIWSPAPSPALAELVRHSCQAFA